MNIVTNGYSDFLVVHNALGSNKSTVFYVDNGSNLFIIHEILASNNTDIISGNLGTMPSSFATDFPHAIQTTNPISVSG
jgi:hypothetical protein